MKLKLEHADELGEELCRLLIGRIEKSLDHLGTRPSSFTDKQVHELRKEFKQIRALLRLLHPLLKKKIFARENRTFRNLGRPLSDLRDGTALLTTTNELAKHGPASLRIPLTRLRSLLKNDFERTQSRMNHTRLKTSMRAELNGAAKRIRDWSFPHATWPAVVESVTDLYRGARRASRKATLEADDETWHDFRKRAKDLRYVLETLSPFWPAMMKTLADRAKAITDAAGTDHDLAVLAAFVKHECDELRSRECRDIQLAIVAWRTVEKTRAMAIAEDLFAEKPRQFSSRIGNYWKAVVHHGILAAEGD